MRSFSFFSTFLISSLICVTKEPPPTRSRSSRGDDGEFKVNCDVRTYIRNRGVNGRRCGAIDSIEIHGETNSWLRAVRDKGQFSKYVRDPVSRGARQQPCSPKALLHFMYRYSQYAIIPAVVTHSRVRELCTTRGGIAVSSHVILVFRTCHRLYAISIKLARLRHLSTSKWNYPQHLILFREIRVPRAAIVTISTKVFNCSPRRRGLDDSRRELTLG